MSMMQQTPPIASPYGQGAEDVGAAVEAQLGKIVTEPRAAPGGPGRCAPSAMRSSAS